MAVLHYCRCWYGLPLHWGTSSVAHQDLSRNLSYLDCHLCPFLPADRAQPGSDSLQVVNEWKRFREVWRSGLHGYFPTLSCMQSDTFFSVTLAHIGYPVAVGVVGWLVDDGKQQFNCQ